MKRSIARAVPVLALGAFATHAAHAGGVTPYFESSANQNPRGNAGLSVTGDRVSLKAGLAARAPGSSTEIVPRVTSAFSISDRIGLETKVDLSDWNSHAAAPGAKFDTRLHFQSSAPFLDELEGRVWRSPDGQSGRILKFGFYQKFSDTNDLTPITVRSRAVVETTVAPLSSLDPTERAEDRRFGIETEVKGLLSRLMSGRGALRIKLDRFAGSRDDVAGSVALDQSWKIRYGQLGLNLGAGQQAAGAVEPWLGLSWRWTL